MQFLVTPSKRHNDYWTSLSTVHRDIPVDIAAVIDEFAKRHPRRITGDLIPGSSGHTLLSSLSSNLFDV